MAKVLIMCNPLLDISADVDSDFLAKYKLQPGNAILAEEGLHGEDFFKELTSNPTVKYIAGGSAMNTARVASWILQKGGEVAYMGAVGNDDFATTLKEGAKKDGVDVEGMLTVTDGTPTGRCGVCITGRERSLVASLAAANKFTFDHMSKAEVQKRVEDAQIVYISGFFLTVCPEAALMVAQHCTEKGKFFCMNMSAPFIMQFFKEKVEQLLPHCNMIFCNDDEAKVLSQMLGFGDLEPVDVAQKVIAENKIKANGTVCFTQGSKPTLLVSASGVEQVEVPKIDVEKIIDTNGAGDSFVGGFLAMLSQGKSYKRCAQVGNYAAGVVIQHSGCAYPETPSVPAE